MLGWEFPPHSTGGLGFACLGLAQALSYTEGAEISFVLPRKIDVSHPCIRFLFADLPIMGTERNGGTAGSVYMTSEEYELRLKSGEKIFFGSSLLEEVRLYALHIRKIARSEDFDVIHAHDWLSMLAGVEAKKISGKPLVVHVHATSFDQAGGDNANPSTYAIEKYGMEEADAVIAVSEYTKNIIVAKYGIDEHKVRVVHNGVLDLGALTNAATDKVLSLKEAGYKIVLFVGRITIQKGADYFLKAAEQVLRFEPNTIFIVAGTGDMEAQLIHQAASLGISDKVLFITKFVEGEERTCLLRSADVFIMPSVSEPFGLLPLEALLEGQTPVIISKQSGVQEVLKHALKVDFWDTDALTDKIVAVLRSEGLATQLKNYGMAEAGGVTWEKAAGKCMNIYEELINFFKSKTQ